MTDFEGAFEQVASGSGAHGRKNEIVIVVHRQDKNADVWTLMQNLARRFN